MSEKTDRAPVVTEALDKMAWVLCALDEDDGVEWSELADAVFSATEHSGDCTKEPHTCFVCLAENYREKVKAALAASGCVPVKADDPRLARDPASIIDPGTDICAPNELPVEREVVERLNYNLTDRS